MPFSFCLVFLNFFGKVHSISADSGESLHPAKKPNGEGNERKNVPNGTFSVRKKFPSGEGEWEGLI
jgi:hypothetical protein